MLQMWNVYIGPIYNSITETSRPLVRLVFGARRLDHTNPLFRQLGILKFVDLVQFKTSIIKFKAYHNELPGSLQGMFNLHVHILWNSLHTNITSCRSLQVLYVQVAYRFNVLPFGCLL